jgi:ABC-2 type transport system permease protein
MSSSIVTQLVRKDLRLHRVHIAVTIAAGLAALGIVARGGEIPVVIGITWFFVAIIVLACMLPMSSIVNERKKQTLAFLMSLPMSAIEYTTAKLLSTLLMFLVPWLMLIVSAVVLVTNSNSAGTIPLLLMLGILPLIGFSVILAVALITESEGWSIAATVVCNSTYGLAFYLMMRVPSLTANSNGHVAIFNPTIVRVLAIEMAIILGLGIVTFFFQSRKRDFL